jgi:glycosyltransferase involved in cell wall biosynthesis
MMDLGPSPRTILGMTLHNNARHLREAADSILAQSDRDFMLLMLDDGSTDETEAIAREYAGHDPRVRYMRHAERLGMVPTWREVASQAAAEFPNAPYFAWVSDHDRWHPDWLARLVSALDGERQAVLAYPMTPRIDETGAVTAKEPRRFDTAGTIDLAARWREFCHNGFGSGDMVYGVMRMSALRACGYFRAVLNPDRLLIAELTLQGGIVQVMEPLWWRREAAVASIERQRVTLFAGEAPAWFGWPPTLQHARMLWREYAQAVAPPVRIPRVELAAMLARYQLTTVWRYFRKTDASKSLGRGVDNVHWIKKVIKKGFHHAVYYTLVAWHQLKGKGRRLGRRTLYEFLMLTHRTGLRGPRGGTRTP